MSRENDEIIKDHEYDGIQEFDNPMPDWWLGLFFATIIFAFVYFLHYEIAGGPTQEQELALALDQLKSLKKGGPVFSEESLSGLFNDEAIGKGLAIYSAKCAACHGNQGEGLIGPNLSDLAWLHGKGTRSDILKVISEGVPDKGMPAWADMMAENEVMAVSAFVFSIKGKNAPGGKPAQGQEFP